ncbi:hypothetical protein SNE40_010088 [Patella caerulea]|uniref:G-protein coupled receptors family 1 profile domain-containing protein n=1 Tax=Patella caerulea TaxID=87958 RepID=A0AAN8PU27_PATCE
MVIVIAIAFIVAWSPQYIVSIVSQLQSLHGGINFLQKGQFLFTMLMTHLCGFLNSCINPFIYTIMSRKFRKSFRYIFTRVFFCCQKKRTYRYQTSLTRNQSAGLSSVGKQSLTEFRDGNEYRLSEAPSSGGDSSGGSQQGRGFQVRYKDSSQSLIESRGSNKKWATSSGKHHSGGSLIVLKCFKYKERAFKDTDGEVFENTNVPDNNTLNIKDNRRQGYLNDKAPKIEITVEDQDSILKDPKLLEIDCLETKLGHSNGKINGFALNGECETLS